MEDSIHSYCFNSSADESFSVYKFNSLIITDVKVIRNQKLGLNLGILEKDNLLLCFTAVDGYFRVYSLNSKKLVLGIKNI